MTIKFDDIQREELGNNKLYTPRFVWILFVVCEFVTFYDRGAMAGALQQIRQDSDISGGRGEILDGTKAGLLTSLFIVGFLIFSPIFTALGGTLTSRTLLVIGMALWIASVLLSGFAPNFATLVFARCLTGVGEAAFTPFQVVTIENIAPSQSRTLWIGVWYAMIAVGTAAGMGIGATTAAKVELADGTPGWRLTFFVEACCGGIVGIFLLFLPKEYNVYDLDASVIGPDEDAIRETLVDRADLVGVEHGDYHVPIWIALKELCRNKDYILLNAGYACYLFMVGAVGAWMVQMVSQSALNLTEEKGGMMIGGIMAVCGLLGSAIGGKLVDKYAPVTNPYSVPRAMLFASACLAVAIPLAGVSLLAQHLWLYLIGFIPAVFCLFSLVPAVTVSLLGVVPSHLRPYSISVSMIIIHLFGDAISPTVVGALSSAFARDCDGAPEDVCDWMSFVNVTYDESNSWLDGECRWIPAPHNGDSPFCSNTMKINKAILICLCTCVLALPCWLLVALKRKCCYDFDTQDRSSAALNRNVSEKEYKEQQQKLVQSATPTTAVVKYG